MGLDNGIILKTKNKINKFPWFVNEEALDCKEIKNGWEYEILYYRKCWGIRGEICHLLHFEMDIDGNYMTPVEAEDIPAIIRILEKYLMDKDYYEDNAESIWEYDEMIQHLKDDIKTLLWFKEYLENNKDNIIECYWYDSY